MAARRFEDVLLGEINKLRLENLNLHKGKPLLEPLIVTDVKHAEKIADTSVVKVDKIKHDLFEMIDHLPNEVITRRTELEKIKGENTFTQ